MKEYSVIADEHRVKAILAGRQTQWRMPIKVQPPAGTESITPAFPNEPAKWWDAWVPGDPVVPRFKAPYVIGDRLWVKETVVIMRPALKPTLEETLLGKPSVYYVATDRIYKGEKKTSSIHMPRWASRILLEVTDVRVGRIQEMSFSDLDAEGFEHKTMAYYSEQWDIDNAKRGYSWKSNPWCWLNRFKKISPQEKTPLPENNDEQ